MLSHPLYVDDGSRSAVTTNSLAALKAEVIHRLRVMSVSIPEADVIVLHCRTILTPAQEELLLKNLREILLGFVRHGSTPLFVGSLSGAKDDLSLVTA